MTAYPIPNPFSQWVDTTGLPLTGARIYIGVAGDDPETNPIAVYQDAALSVPFLQPLRTVGGYLIGTGTPANAYPSVTPYSLKVCDAANVQIYYVATVHDEIADALAALTAIVDGLSGPTGAAQIGYKAPGTNTVATTSAAILDEKIYLWNYLSPAQRTALATQTFGLDMSAALQQAVDDADGREVNMREGGILLNSRISRVTTGSPYGGGMKLIGCDSKNCVIQTNVAGSIGSPMETFNLDTSVTNTFQKGIYLDGFTLSATAHHPVYARGWRFNRTYDVVVGDVTTIGFSGDGYFNPVAVNDADGSNQIRFEQSAKIQDCLGWAYNHAPAVGFNDLSFFDFHGSISNCGTYEGAAVTGVSLANPCVITVGAGHPFVDGELVRLAGIKGPSALNLNTYVATVINSTTFSIPVNTSAYPAYTSGGMAMRAEPRSGGIRWCGQMGLFGQNGWMTQTKNVGLLIPVGGVSFLGNVDKFTIENPTGYHIIVMSANGASIENSDLRVNGSISTAYAAIVLDATSEPVLGVNIDNNNFIAFNQTNDFTAMEGIAGGSVNGGSVSAKRNNWIAFTDEVGSTKTKYGSGLYAFPGVEIIDGDAVQFQPKKVITPAAFSSASPSYTPDVTVAEEFALRLGAGSSGTFTLNLPTSGTVSGATLTGRDMIVSITNSSGGAINLAYGSLGTKSAPTSIANGVTIVGKWTYNSVLGWYQSAGWI